MPDASHTLAEIPFPDARAVVASDATRYQALPPRERWQRLFALRAWGMRQSVSRPVAPRESAAEVRWQEIQRELFTRHAR
ncbi:MAG: hypothetical protein ACOVJ6_02580 [Pirellulales bacterium]|jgi:hypothetical protein